MKRVGRLKESDGMWGTSQAMGRMEKKQQEKGRTWTGWEERLEVGEGREYWQVYGL